MSDFSSLTPLQPLLSELRQLIQQARAQALRAVDTIQVQTSWQVGCHIVEFEQGGRGAGYLWCKAAGYTGIELDG